MALRFAALLLAAAAPAMGFVDPCTVDYTTYSPGKVVNEWTQGDFEATLQYGKQVGFSRVLPVAIVGVLVLFSIMIWWCCRACDKCRSYKQGAGCHTILLLGTISLMIAGGILIILGFAADRKQSDAMQSVPTIIASIETYTSDIGMLAEADSHFDSL